VAVPVSSNLRIGAFSRRVGISAAVLRAWEARYGLFAPIRTPGGYRLYGPEDEQRAQRMRALTAHGLAAAESARLVLAERRGTGVGPGLAEAWRALDAVAAQRALDELLDTSEPEVVAAEVILPLLRSMPAEHRHFAARMLETRLLALAERWHDAPGSLALVGCGPGEHDTIATILCALGLHRRGWRIVYLGADTPVDVFRTVAAALLPARIVVGFADSEQAASVGPQLAPLGPLSIVLS
jgi:MerR family transcriptional regulator, light-induced transcriptional regulator